MSSENRIPTTEKLAQALREAGAPDWMIVRAESGYYDDYKSTVSSPIMALVVDAHHNGLHAIAHRARNGDFDAQKWEADAWAKSPEGQESIASFTSGFSPIPGGVRWSADRTKDK